MLQPLKPAERQCLSKLNTVQQNMAHSLSQQPIYRAEIYGSKTKGEGKSVPLTVILKNNTLEFLCFFV